jgi:hypothetical protein
MDPQSADMLPMATDKFANVAIDKNQTLRIVAM